MARPDSDGRVTLVDEDDNEIGTLPKLEAHRDGGRLHRAFSIFIFNDGGELLLQRRAARKYHFGGLWSNTCCSHPTSGEPIAVIARQRLFEEMGIIVPALVPLFTFVYRAEDLASGFTEHELDHVLVGYFNEKVSPNAEEVDDARWVSPAALTADLSVAPQNYTPWLRIALPRVMAALSSKDASGLGGIGS